MRVEQLDEDGLFDKSSPPPNVKPEGKDPQDNSAAKSLSVIGQEMK